MINRCWSEIKMPIYCISIISALFTLKQTTTATCYYFRFLLTDPFLGSLLQIMRDFPKVNFCFRVTELPVSRHRRWFNSHSHQNTIKLSITFSNTKQYNNTIAYSRNKPVSLRLLKNKRIFSHLVRHYVDVMTALVYSVSKKKSPLLNFSDIFSKTVGNF